MLNLKALYTPTRYITITSSNNATLLVMTGHFLFLSLILFACAKLGLNIHPLTNENLRNWDADWYYRIKTVGYYFVADRQGTLAFFPLFPFFWKFTQLSEQGIGIINLAIYFISFYFIARHFKFSYTATLLFLSAPSAFFCYMPYSESIFFLSATLLLIGFEKKNYTLLIIGLILGCFTRSISMIFIAAMIFTYIVAYKCRKKDIIILTGILTLIVAITIIVFLIQYTYTDQWMYFFKMQKLWGKELQLPTFPLFASTREILWIDGVALSISLFAVYQAVMSIYKAATDKGPQPLSAAFIFSVSYICLLGFLSVFYSGVLPGQPGTTLMSLNRYIFATPYFIFFIYYKSRQGLTSADYIILLIIAVIISYCLGAYTQSPLLAKNMLANGAFFISIPVYITGWLWYKKIIVCIPLYLFNCCAQLYLLNVFLSNYWVG